jgi:ppGpp synthetase/RelA/SpoT-type nucleotidyltranferase
MPLPMTKGEINRLGERLAASETPSQADLVQLAKVLAAYQVVLESVMDDLRALGFSPTGRVKTTTSMISKLRRIRGMDLSRVQDLAGARFVVDDLTAQDMARDKIREFYSGEGCPVIVTDRRTDPSYGYRAVHVRVTIQAMPVEIQIRTELQDSWAQIVERLADRWGRGIRYGEDPERPYRLSYADWEGRSVRGPRRQVVEVLGWLSEDMYDLELSRQLARVLEGLMYDLAPYVRKANKLPRWLEYLAIRLKAHSAVSRQMKLAKALEADLLRPKSLLAEWWIEFTESETGRALGEVMATRGDLTPSQVQALRVTSDSMLTHVVLEASRISLVESRVRGMLQIIGAARDEGV